MSLTGENLDWPEWAVQAMTALDDSSFLANQSWEQLQAALIDNPETDLAERFAQAIGAVAATEAEIASLAARRARQVEQARELSEAFERITRPVDAQRWSPAMAANRVLVSEVAAVLRLPERTAETLVGESRILVTELRGTLAALDAGDISYRHAQRLIDHASSLPAEARAEFEADVLDSAKTMPVGKFNDVARKRRERMHPESVEVRHVRSVADREVWLQNGRDGMASLTLYTDASDAHAAFDRISGLAASLQAPDDPRTLTQLRADAMVDLLIDGVTPDGLGAGVKAEVLITVPVMTLLGCSDEPATLEGYGPIDLETAKRLMAGAPGFTRLLTHPETGAVLSVGRERYRPTKAMRKWLRVRDETCRFPGCNRSAERCDLDHTLDWQYSGETGHTNLAHLCPGHHAMKHNTAWRVNQQPDGTLDWTSPTRRRYRTGPATRMGPAPVHTTGGRSAAASGIVTAGVASQDGDAPPF
jgi:hypothetical protein